MGWGPLVWIALGRVISHMHSNCSRRNNKSNNDAHNIRPLVIHFWGNPNFPHTINYEHGLFCLVLLSKQCQLLADPCETFNNNHHGYVTSTTVIKFNCPSTDDTTFIDMTTKDMIEWHMYTSVNVYISTMIRWCRWWLKIEQASSSPSHYLNQYCNIVNWTFQNTFQWFF